MSTQRIVGAALLAITQLVSAQAVAPPQASTSLTWPNYQLTPRLIAADTWVFEGAVDDFSKANGCNIINTIVIGNAAGAMVINTGPSFLYGQQQRLALTRVGLGAPQQVLNLNLHPDYFFGNQAYLDVPLAALPGSIAGMQREGKAYADNLYRLCGDWMKDSEATPAQKAVQLGMQKGTTALWAGHAVELLRLGGHTDDDLVVLDHTTGVVLAGGLVFTGRAPTTPHANLPQWLQSLDVLEARLKTFPLKALVPSHGAVRADTQGIDDTRRYLQWLDQRFRQAAQNGMDLAEVIAMPIPPEFAKFAAVQNEYLRNVTHLYAHYEKAALQQK